MDPMSQTYLADHG